MSDAEFDRFARSYRDIHKDNINLSGEEPEYFARYKMLDFAATTAAVGASAQGRYLDFGSGIGASVQPFIERMPNARLLCADVSAKSLEQSKTQHGDAADYLVIDDDGHIALPDHALDGAFACCVFHHIPHHLHHQALVEIRRVLRPGAPLMVYEHNPLNPLTVRAVNTCPLDENAVLIGGQAMLRLCLDAGFASARLEFRVFFPASLGWLRPLERRLRWLPLGAQYAVHALS